MARSMLVPDEIDEEAARHPIGDEPPHRPDDEDGDRDGEDEGDRRPWVTVATFWQPMDAHLARIKLQSEGIECALIDEYLVATDWLYANAVGGIKLQVPQGRFAEAREALEPHAGRAVSAVDGPAQTVDSETPDGTLGYARAACPSCGSPKIRRQRWTRRSVSLAILLLGFPLPFMSRQWTCDECGHEWKRTAV